MKCEFGDFALRMRDQFVFGIRDRDAVEALLEEDASILTLDLEYKKAISIERSKREAQEVMGTSTEINAVEIVCPKCELRGHTANKCKTCCFQCRVLHHTKKNCPHKRGRRVFKKRIDDSAKRRYSPQREARGRGNAHAVYDSDKERNLDYECDVEFGESRSINIFRGIEKLFVDSFEDRGLDQCLTVPTHIKGRTLDILLTNSQSLISSLYVLEKNSICKSDHFPITFEIKTNFKTKPIPKRQIYNFKKANWEGLVKSLEEVEWDRCLNNREPEYAWQNFKIILFHLVDTYIPTITIKSTFSSPWFDSECYEAYRDKKGHISHALRVLIMK